MKLQEPGVMGIINRNRSLMEPFSEIVEEALANETVHLTTSDAFSQQENDEIQAELAYCANDLLDQKDETDSNLLFEESSLPSSYTGPILMSDNELNAKKTYSIKSSVNSSIKFKVGQRSMFKINRELIL